MLDRIPLFVLFPQGADNKKEEFRKYLEKSGVVDALTKVLVGLYEVRCLVGVCADWAVVSCEWVRGLGSGCFGTFELAPAAGNLIMTRVSLMRLIAGAGEAVQRARIHQAVYGRPGWCRRGGTQGLWVAVSDCSVWALAQSYHSCWLDEWTRSQPKGGKGGGKLEEEVL